MFEYYTDILMHACVVRKEGERDIGNLVKEKFYKHLAKDTLNGLAGIKGRGNLIVPIGKLWVIQSFPNVEFANRAINLSISNILFTFMDQLTGTNSCELVHRYLSRVSCSLQCWNVFDLHPSAVATSGIPGIVENHRFEIPRVENHATVKVQKLFVNRNIVHPLCVTAKTTKLSREELHFAELPVHGTACDSCDFYLKQFFFSGEPRCST